jgi:IclR family acetate operon transcriptional repressor
MSNEGASGDVAPAGRSSGSVQSVDRALRVLEILAERGASGVTEIAAELGVHKSTAFRLVSVLEDHQLVEQVGDRGKYHLGFGVVRLAGATSAQLDLSRDSRQACEQLASELGETVNIAVLEGMSVINISQARGGAAIASHNWVGQLTPTHATSSGKVLLAALPAARLAELLAQPLERFTQFTVTAPAQLRAELSEVAARGYGLTQGELEVGLNAVAAPVRSLGGEVVAALSVSGPSYRLTEDRLRHVATQVCAAAAEISRRLGYRERAAG